MAERIQLTETQRAVLLDPEQLPPSIRVNGKRYTPEEPVAAGYKGVVWRVRDEFSRLRALKLCTYADYQGRSYLQEASRAAKLEPFSEFAKFVDAGLVEHPSGTRETRQLVGFVEEWIEGLTLDRFVCTHYPDVTAAFLLAYAQRLSAALSALAAVNLRHDDLHAGNVMLTRPVPGSATRDWLVKIIDTGSLKPGDSPRHKPQDDHRHFVDHLVLIWNTVYSRKTSAVRDRRFLTHVKRLLHSMLDDEPSIALREPAQVSEQFDLAYTRACAPRPDHQIAPNSPFEFISAEHIADDRLLVQIFARSCPFLDKVDGPDPCLVTGPRGCGKSTIFRWLSLKAHLHKDADAIDEFRIAGFYVSCSSDLQNKLGWIDDDTKAKRFSSEIIHYFNLVLLREVLQTLAMLSARDDRVSVWGFGVTEEKAVWRFIVDSFEPMSRPRLQGVPRLVQALEMVEEALFLTHSQMLRGSNLAWCTNEAFLGDLTALLAGKISYFQSKRITFLIDDFSSHRIPPPVQVLLNRVIWERRPSHIFKLSAEKYGAELTDVSGATVEPSREMVEIDCGREYLALDDPARVGRAKRFAIELLDNRLAAAGYRGTSETLIGPSAWPEGSLGRALAEKPRGRITDQYHGIDCIASVCSGDVSTLLLVYRRVFERGNLTKDSTSRVRKDIQHDAIVNVSRQLLDAIRHHFPYGPEMYSIVAAFGNLVRNVLEQGKHHKKGDSSVPPQCPRIELDQTRGAAVEVLTQEQRDLALELVRRAVFIEMEIGLSRHRHLTTLRWHLRRVYLPAFGASLAKNDAVKEPIDWFKFLLTDADGACEMVWRRWPRQSGGPRAQSLF